MQSELFYPNFPGYKERTTSRAAATAVAPGAATLRAAVLAELRRRSQTADEVAAALGASILSIRPRVSELRAAGLIGPDVTVRKNISGHSARVWRILPPP